MKFRSGQKTDELFVAFGPDGVTSVPLSWCRTRTVTGAAPEWCLRSGAVPFLAPLEPAHAALVNSAVDGPNRFELKREVIDDMVGAILARSTATMRASSTRVRRPSCPTTTTSTIQLQALRISSCEPVIRDGTRCPSLSAMWWTSTWTPGRGTSQPIATGILATYHYGDADTSTHRTFPLAGKGRFTAAVRLQDTTTPPDSS